MANGKLSSEWLRTIIIVIVQLGALLIWGATLQTQFRDHIENEDVHMTFKEKATLFVPRQEIKSELKGINDKLDLLIKAGGLSNTTK